MAGVLSELQRWASERAGRAGEDAVLPTSSALQQTAAGAASYSTFEVNWFSRNWKSITGQASMAVVRKAWLYFTDPVRCFATVRWPVATDDKQHGDSLTPEELLARCSEVPADLRLMDERDAGRMCLEFIRAVPEITALRKDIGSDSSSSLMLADLAEEVAQSVFASWTTGPGSEVQTSVRAGSRKFIGWSAFRARFLDCFTPRDSAGGAGSRGGDKAVVAASVDRLAAPPDMISTLSADVEARAGLLGALAPYGITAILEERAAADEKHFQHILELPPQGRTASQLEQVRNLLLRSPFFQEMELRPALLNELCRLAKYCRVAPGETLFRQGDRDPRLFLVLGGDPLLARLSDAIYGGQRTVSLLEKGDVFGHAALASIPLVTVLDGEDPQLLEGEDGGGEDAGDTTTSSAAGRRGKSAGEIRTASAAATTTAVVPGDGTGRRGEKSKDARSPAGTTDSGAEVRAVLEAAELALAASDPAETAVAKSEQLEKRPGSTTGSGKDGRPEELEANDVSPRPCSVVAPEEGRGTSLLVVDRKAYEESVQKQQRRDLIERVSLLRSQPGIGSVPLPSLLQLAHTLSVRRCSRDEVVLQQGEPQADRMYFVRRGKFRVIRELPPGGLFVEVRELGPLSMFGEHGALLGQPRAASVVAVSPDCELLVARRLDLLHCMDKTAMRRLSTFIEHAYPSDAELRASLAREDRWERYKQQLHVAARTDKLEQASRSNAVRDERSSPRAVRAAGLIATSAAAPPAATPRRSRVAPPP